MTIFAERMMLVSLHLSVYAGTKVDHKVTGEVVTLAGAQAKSGKFVKNLFQNSLEDISKVAAEARKTHARLTLPWRHGQECLPSGLFMKYMEAMREVRARFDGEVAKFLDGYNEAIEQSKRTMGTLFKESDYPTWDEAAAKFLFDLEVSPLPNVADFRVDLADEERGEIIEDIERRINSRVEEGQVELRDRIKSCLQRMEERLSNYTVGADGKVEGRFNDTLVTNLSDLCDLIPGFNVTGDEAITSLHGEIVAKLIRHDAKTLREDEGIRNQVAKDAEALLKKLAGVYA